MSKFAKFMKANKTMKENGFYPATKSLCDERGNPLEWEIRHITSAENEAIREGCMVEVQVTGKPNMFRQKINTGEYITKLLIASCVVPDLYDAELQDSYGVSTPEELLFALVDDPGEYDAFTNFIQKFNGFNVSMEDKVEEAKN